eukprot:TRINITY_DN67012_c8_g4_i2.p1 TRINITY_DN67012_c8_g4~~TRINITY_DN67012_c8_g4_i2.p1  ORF type:complete len:133 (+),score=19.09 TRINITY_DN67012_c8_g4_i2:58-456(+)
MKAVLCVVMMILLTAEAGPFKENFFNPKPREDPAPRIPAKYLGQSTDSEVMRLHWAVVRQNQAVTNVVFYGHQIVVEKVDDTKYTAWHSMTPCGSEPAKKLKVEEDEMAFVKLATELVNRGIVMANRVEGKR